MEVNNCCKVVAKTIVDKMKSGNSIIVSVMASTTTGDSEIRLYSPNGKAIGSKSVLLAKTDTMFEKGITSKVDIDIDILVRNQNG